MLSKNSSNKAHRIHVVRLLIGCEAVIPENNTTEESALTAPDLI
jgi:hypothetical protein